MQKYAEGIFDGVPNEFYHGDCCDLPSLSSSGARLIDAECPALFYEQSYLNPEAEREEKRCFDIGNAAHLIMLEHDRFDSMVVVVEGFTKEGKPSPGYATSDAKEQRDRAYEAGKIPLLRPEAENIRAMRKVFFGHPISKHALVGGTAERSFFVKDPDTGVMMKCRPDYTPGHSRYRLDYKTASSVNPDVFQRALWERRYFMQGPWCLDVERMLTGEEIDTFYFINQTPKKPYLITVVELDMGAAAWGRMMNRRALDTFARCLDKGEWPGYRSHDRPDVDRAFVVGLPYWAERRLQIEHEAGAFKRAIDAHAPLTPPPAANILQAEEEFSQ